MINGGDDNMFSGKWFNPHTGQEIFVRNTIETEQGMQIMTSVGPMNGDQFSKFVKCEDEGGVSINKQPEQPPQMASFDPEIVKELESAKQNTIQNTTTNTIQQSAQLSQPVNSNHEILKKLFDKQTTEPDVKITIEWENFPKTQLETFINVLDISREDIASYLIENYLDTYHLIESVADFLDKELEK